MPVTQIVIFFNFLVLVFKLHCNFEGTILLHCRCTEVPLNPNQPCFLIVVDRVIVKYPCAFLLFCASSWAAVDNAWCSETVRTLVTFLQPPAARSHTFAAQSPSVLLYIYYIYFIYLLSSVTLSTFKQKLNTHLFFTVISRHIISPHIDVQWLQCFCICSLKIIIDWLIDQQNLIRWKQIQSKYK